MRMKWHFIDLTFCEKIMQQVSVAVHCLLYQTSEFHQVDSLKKKKCTSFVMFNSFEWIHEVVALEAVLQKYIIAQMCILSG